MTNLSVAVSRFKQVQKAGVRFVVVASGLTTQEAKERLFQFGTRRLAAARLARKYARVEIGSYSVPAGNAVA